MAYSIVFFYVSLSLYFLSASLFTAYLIKKNPGFFSYFKQWLLIASISGGFFFLTRYREAGHLPLVTLFEITFFYAWMISVFYLIFVKKDMARFIQGLSLAIICAILVWGIFLDKGIYALNPLLNSFWLGIHVPSAILGYSAFALSFVVSLYYVFAEREKSSLNRLAGFNAGLIAGGLVFLGICIATGSIWAKSAWGRFWSWDPKETWALITFVIYGSSVLARKVFRLNPRRQALFSVAGFLVMLFTFFGINLVSSSHHAY